MPENTLRWKEKVALKIVLEHPIRIVAALLQTINRILGKFASKLMWIAAWLKFLPREDDIYIVSYPRSGTTLLQMVLYQLMSDGSMDFTHISEIIPYLERAVKNKFIDLNKPSHRRIIKTHLTHNEMYWWPGKYIYVTRNGPDVLFSYFKFYQSHLGFRGNLDDFFQMFMEGKVAFRSWFSHVAEWNKCANDPNVLFLKYEDLATNLTAILPQIIEFCGITASSSICARALERSSFSFMKQHEDRFDFITEILLEMNMVRGEFIRTGSIGTSRDHLSEEQLKSFEVAAQRTFQNL